MTEIMAAPFSFGKMPLTIMTESRKNLKQTKYVRSWILRLSVGREADIIALPRKDMGSRDAGFGEMQMVATTKVERDLLTFPKPNRWHFLLTSPTEKRAVSETGRLIFTQLVIGCCHCCIH